MLYKKNATAMSAIIPTSCKSYTASANTTAIVASPFGAFSAMYNFSCQVYPRKLNEVPMNLMNTNIANSIPDVAKKCAVYGMSITNPVNMNNSIVSAFVITLSVSSNLIFSFT